MRQRSINFSAAMRDMRNHRSPEKRLMDEMLAVCRATKKAHEELFAQCASNPITNAWGKEVSVASLNEAARLAEAAIKKMEGVRHG